LDRAEWQIEEVIKAIAFDLHRLRRKTDVAISLDVIDGSTDEKIDLVVIVVKIDVGMGFDLRRCYRLSFGLNRLLRRVPHGALLARLFGAGANAPLSNGLQSRRFNRGLSHGDGDASLDHANSFRVRETLGLFVRRE
jgi:hypothetical protein